MIAHPNHRPPPAYQLAERRNRIAVEATIDYLSLPASTLTPRRDVVHITVANAAQLSHWQFDLGGEVRHTASTDGVALWTLYTNTPTRADGSTVAIRVHCPVVEGDDVLTDVRWGVPA